MRASGLVKEMDTNQKQYELTASKCINCGLLGADPPDNRFCPVCTPIAPDIGCDARNTCIAIMRQIRMPEWTPIVHLIWIEDQDDMYGTMTIWPGYGSKKPAWTVPMHSGSRWFPPQFHTYRLDIFGVWGRKLPIESKQSYLDLGPRFAIGGGPLYRNWMPVEGVQIWRERVYFGNSPVCTEDLWHPVTGRAGMHIVVPPGYMATADEQKQAWKGLDFLATAGRARARGRPRWSGSQFVSEDDFVHKVTNTIHLVQLDGTKVTQERVADLLNTQRRHFKALLSQCRCDWNTLINKAG